MASGGSATPGHCRPTTASSPATSPATPRLPRAKECVPRQNGSQVVLPGSQFPFFHREVGLKASVDLPPSLSLRTFHSGSLSRGLRSCGAPGVVLGRQQWTGSLPAGPPVLRCVTASRVRSAAMRAPWGRRPREAPRARNERP